MKAFLAICVLLVVGSVECNRARRFAFFGAAGGAAAVAGPPNAKATGMDAALAPMADEKAKEDALGGPVNTAGLDKASDMTGKIQAMDGPSGAAGVGAAAADFSGFLESAKAPEDTAVAAPGPGAPPAPPARR